MDAVDMGLDTREKLLAWLKRKGITLEFYKTTPEWKRLIEAYPYAKEL
jgi:aryl carrier-like protein